MSWSALLVRRSLLYVLFILGGATSFALADETALANQFDTQKIEPAVADQILERARFLKQDTPDRPQLDARMLRTIGAVPQYSLAVDNAIFHLAGPFAFYGDRQIALAFVEVDDEVDVRVLYRSNSQFSWRMCDATDGGHIGKGFHEFDKQVPIPVSVALLNLHNQPQELKSLDGLVPQSELANILLRGLTLDRKSSQCISQDDGHYYTREYAAFMPSQPMPFMRVSQWLATPSSLRVADPQATQLPPRERLPDLNKPIAVLTFASAAYAEVNAGDSAVTGRVFMSLDGDYRYLFFEDSSGRAALSVVEALQPRINALGLRNRYLDTTGMDSPLMEYYLQIPAEYGGLKQAGYCSNWNYLRELPIIKYYYAEQHREVPAVETPATAN